MEAQALAHVRGAARVRRAGALLPEVDRLWGVPQRADYHPEVDTGVHLMMVLDMAARLNAPLPCALPA
jgi:tRNA nucleotidyltransferase (CCA-adding enzyme)